MDAGQAQAGAASSDASSVALSLALLSSITSTTELDASASQTVQVGFAVLLKADVDL